MCSERDAPPAAQVDGYLFHECPACGFFWAPACAAAEMAARYRDGYHGADDGAPVTGWADARFLEPALHRLGHSPLKILDVGTGNSELPEQLRVQGHRVMAIDVAPPLRAHPDRLTGSMLTTDVGSAYDLVFAFQVMEHLPEPRPYLDRMLDVLRPRGLLTLHTDMEVPERQAGAESWPYVCPPDHCSIFSHRTFERYAAERGAAVVHREPCLVVIEKTAPR